MTKRWIAVCIIVCLGISSVVGCRKKGPPTEIHAHQASLDVEDSSERVLYVSMAEALKPKPLTRPPVKFDHDRHTTALESEPDACGLCHKTDDSGNLQFSFPKDRDDTNTDALMDSFHDSCVGCHTRPQKQGILLSRKWRKKSGPVICGECHAVQREHPSIAYQPFLPEYYKTEILRDTYHKNCTACHRESDKHAGPLDWQKFYVAQKDQAEANWPGVVFDYALHDKHSQAGKCFECHDISQDGLRKMMAGEVVNAQDLGMGGDAATADGTHQESPHQRCINCHLAQQRRGNKAGPVQCVGCHTGVEPSIEELAAAPRPICKREERILIQLEEGGNMEAVAFDHKSHVANSRSCKDCHHKTLQSCQECHTVEGSQLGGGVTLAEAHHDVSSKYSCVGCHEAEKSKPNCAGCHQNMQRGLVMSACTRCHNGSLDALDNVANLPAPEELIPDDVKAEMEISHQRDFGPFKDINRQYGPSVFPHLEIARELTRISNESTLARHFHADQMTICSSCHHSAPLVAKADMPPCATCHTARGEPQNGTPALLGAYHQQCLGCHQNQKMDRAGRALPQDCTGCHQEKSPGGETLAAHIED